MKDPFLFISGILSLVSAIYILWKEGSSYPELLKDLFETEGKFMDKLAEGMCVLAMPLGMLLWIVVSWKMIEISG